MADATFLYVLRLIRPGVLDNGPTPEETAIVGRHLAYLTRLHAEGKLILAGRTTASGAAALGLCLLKAESLSDAAAMAASDPAVVEGLMTAETFPFSIAVGGFTPV